MEQDERDLVVMADDEGNELTMEVMDYFFYEGQEYAVLIPYDEDEEEEECACESEDCACCHEHEQREAYIMRVMPVGEDEEEFVPVEEDLLGKLIDFVQNDLYNDDEFDEDEDEDEEFEEEEDPKED